MIAPNKGVEYSGSVDQYKLIAGFLMIPVRNNTPRNCSFHVGQLGVMTLHGTPLIHHHQTKIVQQNDLSQLQNNLLDPD